MHTQKLRNTIVAALAILTVSSALAEASEQSVAFDMPFLEWLSRQPPRQAPPHPRRRAMWRETHVAPLPLPPQRLACVSLSCPGVIILGVGF
ncbi:hypothetical protein [Methylocapsa aurea]|uniref:hypothetical protein n=1 Tax=Methylocapsa aurea TaxID=663610 RepID=UPI00055A015F|nr:hypothetical protein [Methylocapsa aurea]